MAFVAIVGAGTLGGELARKLALRDRIGEIRLVDESAGVAAGKALDIQQSGPIDACRARLTGSGDTRAAAGAAVIVLADRPGGDGSGAEWQGENALTLLKQLQAIAPSSVFVCAGASQHALLGLAVRELHLERSRIAGSAPLALASAVRALAALEANRSPADVSLTVLGLPPDRMVIPWSGAAIHGVPATAILDASKLARLTARLPYLWPPGPYALASAAARVAEAIVNGSDRVMPCFVALDGELNSRGRVLSVPVRLGRSGIAAIDLPTLSAHEQTLVENALA